MLGRTVGKYRVIERLGRGGMGTVYKAVDETLDREVAIKVLNADLDDAELLKRFRGEAVTLARLNHPGIATLYELYRDDDNLLMVMEYVRGETLHDLAERVGPLAPPQAAHIAVQVLDALTHAHRWGVVHRDLKPANLIVSDSGAVKVMDFGIARVLGTEHFTQGGYMMGTPAYMAPEQVLGGEVDGRSDLYAVGVVLYRLLSGQLPFSADTAIAMVQKQVNEAPTPIAAFQPNLPGWCSDLLGRALAKSPDDRFQSAEEFRGALHAAVTPMAIGDLPTVATPTPLGLRAMDVTLPHQASAPATMSTRLQAGPAVAVATPAAAQPVAAEPLPATPARKSDPTTTTLVLNRKHVFALSGLGVVVLLVIVVLGFLAVRRPSFPSQLGIGAPPPEETAAAGQAPADITLPADGVVPDPADTAAADPDDAGAAAVPAPPPAPAAPPPPVGGAPRAAAPQAPAAVPSSEAVPAPAPAPVADATHEAAPALTAEPTHVGASLPPVSFNDVRLLVTTDGKAREMDGVLRLGDGRVTVLPKDGGAPLVVLPYSALTGAAYSRSKQPKWTDSQGQEVTSKVDLGRFGFMRSERNWVVFLSHGEPTIIRLEDGSLRTALPAIEERTGVKLRR